jgi:hypothetical protein
MKARFFVLRWIGLIAGFGCLLDWMLAGLDACWIWMRLASSKAGGLEK